MWKRLICISFLALASAASIARTEEKEFIPILQQGEEKNEDGSFAYYFEGADGGKREEHGVIKNQGTADEVLVVRGSYSYINADGQEVIVQYIADENGFQPQGTIIPKEISQVASNAAVKAALERENNSQQYENY